MSAYVGIWKRDNSPVDESCVSTLSRVLSRFGPDGERKLIQGAFGLVYRPFHTSSESRHTEQPYLSRRGFLILWDGRLDNRDELILQLAVHFKTKTDVEIVSEAFDRWGTACFSRFVGDWALCIWDRCRQELFLSRDYVGVKQLFYSMNSNCVLYSTHLEAIALSGNSFSLCEEYVAGYLTFYPPEHLTPYQDTFAVPAGSFVRITSNTVEKHQYFNFDPEFRTYCSSEPEYEEQYRFLFEQAVRRRLRTDSPVLAELSGGYDSSATTCMADYIHTELGAEAPSIDTFTFCDPSEPDEEDSRYSALVEAGRSGKNHRVMVEEFGDALSFDHHSLFRPTPDLPRNEIASALPGILKAGNYRVILSGFGGDEVNGQALDLRVLIADLLFTRGFGKTASRELFNWSWETGIPFVQLLWQSAQMLLPTRLRFARHQITNLEPWLNADFINRHGTASQLLHASEGSLRWRPAVRDSFQTLNTFRRQLSQELPSIAEKRYPYLDADFTRFLLSIPPDQLLRPGERRCLMRRALKDVVPNEVLERKTKGAAGRCIALTLSKHWAEIEQLVASPLLADLGMINAATFSEWLVAVKHGKIPPQIVSLLKSLSLELWLRSSLARGIIRSESIKAQKVSAPFVEAVAC